jgi:hypothetical protein
MGATSRDTKEQAVEPMIVALAAVLVVVGGIATYLDSPNRGRQRTTDQSKNGGTISQIHRSSVLRHTADKL